MLLALALNEIRQDYNEQELVNTALNSIEIEIRKNSEFLERRLPYYNSMVDTLNKLIVIHGKDKSFLSVSIPGFNGVNPPMLRKSSFQTAIATQAFSNIDYNLADQISWVYSFQDTYLKWIYIYLNAIAVKDKVSFQRFRGMFKEMSFVWRELLSENKKVLNLLSKQ